MEHPIHCEGLSKRFGSVRALNGLNLSVPAGSISALVGPNGAGKTTLIKLLVNLLRPSSGRAIVLGRDSRALSSAEFACIGYVSENQLLPGWMTVEYFLRYLKPFYPAWDHNLARELVRDFGLPSDRKLSNLSRGMQMKAALASSLAYRPKLIILDEPFSGLDPLVRDELIQGLLRRTEEATILISSHDLAEIESFASHVSFMDNGQIAFCQEITDLQARFREIEVVLQGAPALPVDWPEQWLKPESAPALIRFVDSAFDEERTQREIQHLFPGATSISVRRMALREIFIALAKTSRRAAA
jgi:ABC-2 type transport system ATP-binding protein